MGSDAAQILASCFVSFLFASCCPGSGLPNSDAAVAGPFSQEAWRLLETHFVPGTESLNATLAQWLAWAGMDLDSPLDLLPPGALVESAPSTGEGQYPVLRTWGLELNVRVKYYNYGLISSARISSDLHCVIEVRVCSCLVPFEGYNRAMWAIQCIMYC